MLARQMKQSRQRNDREVGAAVEEKAMERHAQDLTLRVPLKLSPQTRRMSDREAEATAEVKAEKRTAGAVAQLHLGIATGIGEPSGGVFDGSRSARKL